MMSTNDIYHEMMQDLLAVERQILSLDWDNPIQTRLRGEQEVLLKWTQRLKPPSITNDEYYRELSRQWK